MDRNGLSTSGWSDAFWDPKAVIYTLPNGIDILDIKDDDASGLIVADLGRSALKSTTVRFS